MAYVYRDRIKEPSTSTGTGAIVGSGTATPKFLPLSTIGNSNTFAYTIEHDTLTEWEVGIGTYTTAGNSFTRDLVLASSNANALVAFSAGAKTVFNTLPAARIHPPLANTQVGVGDSNSVLSGNADLTYDAVNGRLGVSKPTNSWVALSAANTDPGTAAQATVFSSNSVSNFQLVKLGANYATNGLLVGNMGWLLNNQGSTLFSNMAATDFIWSSSGYSAANEKMRLAANGNWTLSGTSGATPEVSYVPAADGSTARLLVQKSSINLTDIGAVNPSTGTTAYGQVYCGNGASYLIMIKTSTGYTANGLQGPGMGVIGNTAGALLTYNSAVADMIWSIGGIAATAEKMRLNANSLSINIPNPGGTLLSVANGDTGTTSYARLGLEVSGGALYIHKLGANYSGAPAQAWIYNSTGSMLFTNVAAADIVFQRGGAEAMRINGVSLIAGGQPVLRWLGAWQGGGWVYQIGDVVPFGAGTYVCIAVHNNVYPFNTSYWTLLAERPAYGNLPIAATTTWDVGSLSSVWSSVNQSFTMANPINQVAGRTYTWLAVMGGAYTITWGTAFQFPYGRKPVTSTSGCDAYSFFSDGGSMRGVMQPQFA